MDNHYILHTSSPSPFASSIWNLGSTVEAEVAELTPNLEKQNVGPCLRLCEVLGRQALIMLSHMWEEMQECKVY